MKLEVGKSYVARNGDIEKIIGNDGHMSFPFDGISGRSYTPNGSERLFPESPFDLILEHNPKPEGPTLTMSGMRNEMERLNRATKAFLEEYDRD